MEITAWTEGCNSITITLNYNFSAIIIEHLNSNPIALTTIEPQYMIPVNLKEIRESQFFNFSFKDENKHLMNITVVG